MLECLLERISLSSYRDNFVLTGGVLIAAIVGLDTRTTMDLDATLKGQNLTASQIAALFSEVIAVEVPDHVTFTYKSIEEIREESDYPGYRLSFEASLDNTRQTLKVDITTGDTITPHEIEYPFKLMFEDRSIPILAYNIETVLAEKMESILVRGTANTRMRDFYDAYILTATQSRHIDRQVYEVALKNTAEKRGSMAALPKSADIIRSIENSLTMQSLWQRYQKNYHYAREVSWKMTIDTLCSLNDRNMPLPEQPPKAKTRVPKKDTGAR